MTKNEHFWKTKSLNQMTKAEWESLCDGCGKCCLHKLEDIDTGEISISNVSCSFLDETSCRCKDYNNRQENVDDCIQLDLKNLKTKVGSQVMLISFGAKEQPYLKQYIVMVARME